MPSNLADSHASTGAYRRVWCDGESYLASRTPILLGRLLVYRAGVIDLPANMEPCFTEITGHDEATEMGRYQWFPSARDMGGRIEGGYGDDRIQAGDYPGVSVEGGKLTRMANLEAGRPPLEDAECVRSLRAGGSRSVFRGTRSDRAARAVGIEMCGTARRRRGVLGLVATRRTALVPCLAGVPCLRIPVQYCRGLY